VHTLIAFMWGLTWLDSSNVLQSAKSESLHVDPMSNMELYIQDKDQCCAGILFVLCIWPMGGLGYWKKNKQKIWYPVGHSIEYIHKSV
jgi:hypothetical protein